MGWLDSASVVMILHMLPKLQSSAMLIWIQNILPVEKSMCTHGLMDLELICFAGSDPSGSFWKVLQESRGKLARCPCMTLQNVPLGCGTPRLEPCCPDCALRQPEMPPRCMLTSCPTIGFQHRFNLCMTRMAMKLKWSHLL